jgi:hypothetical protein
VVLLIRRTVRPRGYASGFDSPAALLNGLFERPASLNLSNHTTVRRPVSATNLMGRLDPAVLRRFDLKIQCDYLRPDQAGKLFTRVLADLQGYNRSGRLAESVKRAYQNSGR